MKLSKLAKGLKLVGIAGSEEFEIEFAAVTVPENPAFKSIAGRETAAEPNAERRKRTCSCSVYATSFRKFCCTVVRPVIFVPPVTAPAPLPASAEDRPEPVAARR